MIGFLSACVARMSELHPVYRTRLGFARRDLENAIQAGRTVLRGRRPGRADHPPDVIDWPITARYRLDLTHDSLSERKPGPSGDIVQFWGVEIEWNKIKEYLQARAAECWPIDDHVKPPSPNARSRPLTKKHAREFAKDYIEKEKSAGRQPKLSGLEAAAKGAGLRGGREDLRKAFREIQNDAGIQVGRGRPKKSPS